jgi:hypothetical protein
MDELHLLMKCIRNVIQYMLTTDEMNVTLGDTTKNTSMLQYMLKLEPSCAKFNY